MSSTANSVSIVFRPVQGWRDDQAGSSAITGGMTMPCSDFRALRKNDPATAGCGNVTKQSSLGEVQVMRREARCPLLRPVPPELGLARVRALLRLGRSRMNPTSAAGEVN